MQRSHAACPPCIGKPCSRRQIGARSHRGGALILGAVIAGGRSSRFGSDKALALWNGRPLIEHAIAAIAAADEMVVCGRAWPGFRSLADRPAAGLGPLGGFCAALDHAQAGGFAKVVTIGCDMPGVPPALIDRLIAAAPAFIGDAPVLGCWPADFAAMLDAHLAAGGDRSIRRWANACGASPIDAPPLANINTAADFAAS